MTSCDAIDYTNELSRTGGEGVDRIMKVGFDAANF